MPPPTIRFCGECVLKKKGSPPLSTRKLRWSFGRQKLTSVIIGLAARNSYHRWSVTPT